VAAYLYLSSSVQGHCPDGLYLSPTPGDVALWAALFFVQKGAIAEERNRALDHQLTVPSGPYEGAILRFQISFPDTYPYSPPLITFLSDVFHPLVVPLTTYTFSANALDASTVVSASDVDRLPPGAFSLRHSFPRWFLPQSDFLIERGLGSTTGDPELRGDSTLAETVESLNTSEQANSGSGPDRQTLLLSILRHIQMAFEDEGFLDAVAFKSVGDPSAWHAWRAYRGLPRRPQDTAIAPHEDNILASNAPRDPGEWKWDGVWESRMRNAVEASVSEGSLFGATSNVRGMPSDIDTRHKTVDTADRQFRFAKIGEDQFEELRKRLLQNGSAAIAPG
jgi:hypothetical protein